MRKELKVLADAAVSQGWEVEMTKNNHYKFVPPQKHRRILFTGSTPSDGRAWKNFKKELERSGLQLQDNN